MAIILSVHFRCKVVSFRVVSKTWGEVGHTVESVRGRVEAVGSQPWASMTCVLGTLAVCDQESWLSGRTRCSWWAVIKVVLAFNATCLHQMNVGEGNKWGVAVGSGSI